MATAVSSEFEVERIHEVGTRSRVSHLRRAGSIVLVEFMKPNAQERAENLVEALVASRMILFNNPLLIASRINRDNNDLPRRDAARTTVAGLQAAVLKATSIWSEVTAIVPRSMHFDTAQRPGSEHYRSVVDFRDKWVDEDEIARSKADYEFHSHFLEPILTGYDAQQFSAGVSSLAEDSNSPDLIVATSAADLGCMKDIAERIDGVRGVNQMEGSLILAFGRNVIPGAASLAA